MRKLKPEFSLFYDWFQTYTVGINFPKNITLCSKITCPVTIAVKRKLTFEEKNDKNDFIN